MKPNGTMPMPAEDENEMEIREDFDTLDEGIDTKEEIFVSYTQNKTRQHVHRVIDSIDAKLHKYPELLATVYKLIDKGIVDIHSIKSLDVEITGEGAMAKVYRLIETNNDGSRQIRFALKRINRPSLMEIENSVHVMINKKISGMSRVDIGALNNYANELLIELQKSKEGQSVKPKWLKREVIQSIRKELHERIKKERNDDEKTHKEIHEARISKMKTERDFQSKMIGMPAVELTNENEGPWENVLVMEYINGVDGKELGKELLHQDTATRLTVAYLYAKALQKVHTKAVHCDVKPANFMIDVHGNVKATDVGIAVRLEEETPSDSFAGTPIYIAPEVVSGIKDVPGKKPRRDVYALGCILFELFSRQGKKYFPGLVEEKILPGKEYTKKKLEEYKKNQAVWMVSLKRKEHMSESVEYIENNTPIKLHALLKKMLQQDPSKRCDMEEVILEIGRILKDAFTKRGSPVTRKNIGTLVESAQYKKIADDIYQKFKIEDSEGAGIHVLERGMEPEHVFSAHTPKIEVKKVSHITKEENGVYSDRGGIRVVENGGMEIMSIGKEFTVLTPSDVQYYASHTGAIPIQIPDTHSIISCVTGENCSLLQGALQIIAEKLKIPLNDIFSLLKANGIVYNTVPYEDKSDQKATG